MSFQNRYHRHRPWWRRDVFDDIGMDGYQSNRREVDGLLRSPGNGFWHVTFQTCWRPEHQRPTPKSPTCSGNWTNGIQNGHPISTVKSGARFPEKSVQHWIKWKVNIE